jgi:hypothetical protein
MVKGFIRCGLCDIDFGSPQEWEKHSKTKEHQAKLLMFYEICARQRLNGEHVLMRENVKTVQEKFKKEKK